MKTPPMWIHWIVTALLFLTSLAALVNVYKSMFPVTGATFGTTSGSLALIAFAVNVGLWTKAMHCCMGGACKK
jgi:hypothetical protein